MAVLVARAIACAHFSLNLDEGIYLHGAQRILASQRPYRDFLVVTGPGTFWIYGLWFKFFGTRFAAAHALLGLEIGAICGSLYLIVEKLSNRLPGFATVSGFITLLTILPHRLYVNHRWDSAALLTISAAALLFAGQKNILTFSAGLLAGIAAVCTPPVLIVGLALIVLQLSNSNSRSQAPWFALGVVVPLGVTAVILAREGAVGPLLESFRWVSARYGPANRVPYGFVPPETGTSDEVSLVRRLLVYVPAALPLISVALFVFLWFVREIRNRSLLLLLVAGLTLAAACYPRIASNNLLFAAPLLIAFIIAGAEQTLKPTASRIAMLALCIVLVAGSFWLITSHPPSERIDSQLGELNTDGRTAQNIRFATAVINPGDTLFVYPYQPIWFALTGTVNPTRLDFLQPGMMTLQDESVALGELMAYPPDWVIWHNLPPRTIRTIWPHSDPTTLRFERIEQFIRTHYSQVKPPDPNFRYAIAIFHRIQ